MYSPRDAIFLIDLIDVNHGDVYRKSDIMYISVLFHQVSSIPIYRTALQEKMDNDVILKANC